MPKDSDSVVVVWLRQCRGLRPWRMDGSVGSDNEVVVMDQHRIPSSIDTLRENVALRRVTILRMAASRALRFNEL